ncbi:Histone-fold containing protein [Glarea lozoyensis ATCC 20868]|uniref:Histone-fold containing protein n=1 Tax=Glarea lozoyensis (strain ATCC 20868 / MF5171) TaxID=1116229 RepID=S3D1S7_GLAL2|nr:Histone-fold containing protein [Glarea lozoyensis ATCC 20868]EPE32512.1 Histone-fold containing protein [Glarea lozoyensis ATCC 20868]
MPYNNTAIPPQREPTGTTQLPLSRVKKMIMLDAEIQLCAMNAAFTIAVATEMFIQYLAEQGHTVVKSERKPRRNIQYRDLANAVARLDNLEFLVDVVPRTVPFKTIKTSKALTSSGAGNTSANIAAHTANTTGPYVSPFGPNGNEVLNGVVGSNGASSGSGNGGAIDAVMNGNEQDDRAAEDREEDPNKQLELENLRRGSSVNGDESLQDIEMS